MFVGARGLRVVGSEATLCATLSPLQSRDFDDVYMSTAYLSDEPRLPLKKLKKMRRREGWYNNFQ